MISEIYKPINLYPYSNVYEISNKGSLRRKIANKYRYLNPTKGSYGYLMCGLSYKGKMKYISLHRLVALTFISNPLNLPSINHKDENKLNNNVENLEWCTVAYNNRYGSHPSLISAATKGKPSNNPFKKGNFLGYNSKEDYLINHNNIPNPGGFKNHRHSNETKQKIRDKLKRNWKNQFFRLRGGDEA